MLSAKIFEFMGEKLRVIDVDGKFYFVIADVCQMCGIYIGGERQRAIKSVPESERTTLKTLMKTECTKENYHFGSILNSLRTNAKVILVTESGMYRLIMRGHKEEAKRFQNWVVGEVLPSLREKGTYTIPGADQPKLFDVHSQESQLTQGQINFALSIKNCNGASIYISENFSAGTDLQKVSAMLSNIIESVNNIWQ